MALLVSGSSFLFVLFLSGLCVRSSLGLPPNPFTQHALLQRPQLTDTKSPKQLLQQMEKREQVNTVSVVCHPDSLEIHIKADLFSVGAPVDAHELRLGVDHDGFCGATESSGDEYRIHVGLLDCGTKYWMTDDSLVYTNLLIYAPAITPHGVIRMDEAVVPIECHYDRRYSLSSSSLTPTWVPFMSTQAAVETLDLNLRLMTSDWVYERSSNVFHIGEPISLEASVRVGHHMALRVFISSCVATLNPDVYTEPRYAFIEHGCLVDSQLPGSSSHFLPRTQDDKLYLLIDAFRFHNKDKGELYITCHLNAVPVDDTEAPNKACTSINGRWRSADGNDYLCGYCQNQNEAGKSHQQSSGSGMFGPRGFRKPVESEKLWRSGLKTNTVWEKEAKVGPVLVLPAEELPPVLQKLTNTQYGSLWKSGRNRLDLEKGLLPGLATPEKDEDLRDKDAPLEEMTKDALIAEAQNTTAAAPANPTPLPVEDVKLSNTTAQQFDPKRK
ncbi:zona pellucida sperm-binding protein 3-like [Aulostomus maculatus]